MKNKPQGPSRQDRWLSLCELYRRVLACSPSPTDAKTTITDARRNSRLRMRATRIEQRAAPPWIPLTPGRAPDGKEILVRYIGPGEDPGLPPQPSLPPPIVAPNFPILPKDVFDQWDWERRCARWRDSETGTSFRYEQIEVHPDDAQSLLRRLQPPKDVQSSEPQRDEPQRRKPGPKITKDWKLHVAAALARIKLKEGTTPTTGELALICQDECGYLPDESAVAKLVRELLGD